MICRMKQRIRNVFCVVSNILKNPAHELSWIYAKYCKVTKYKVVFSSYAGSGYSGNPKYISDEILRQKLPWDLVWLLKDTETEVPKGVRKVKYKSNRALREIASAHVVISNIRSEARPPKKENQIYLQTWHGGAGFKQVEKAVEDKLGEEYIHWAKEDGKRCDAIISACRIQTDDFHENFWLNSDTEILEIGLPRNDLFFDDKLFAPTYTSVREKYGFSKDQKIILYMPTFRVDHSMDGYALDFQRIVDTMEKKTGEQFAIVIRLHPNVEKQAALIPYNEKIVNGTKYADAQELYFAADYLITDYSSSAFDFALLNKPVFLCMLDYEAYLADRGVTEIFHKCPFAHTYSNEELLETLENFSLEAYEEEMSEFKKYWQPFDDGHASERVVEWLKQKMKETV